MADVVTIKFDPPVEGEATQDGHVGEIDILSYGMASGRAADVTMLQGDTLGSAPSVTFSMVKNADKASAPMFKHCLEGTRFTSATIYVLRNTTNGTETSFEITLETVVIDAMNFGTSSSDPNRGTEDFSLVAAKMKGSAEKQDFTWDFLANTP